METIKRNSLNFLIFGKVECVPLPHQPENEPQGQSHKDLRENNLNNIAPKFGSDLDGTIEENPRHSTAMLRVFRLRPVQRWPEDWRDIVQVIFSQVLRPKHDPSLLSSQELVKNRFNFNPQDVHDELGKKRELETLV